MLARIYRPAKSAMQSGPARGKDWVLEFEPASARNPEPLMGWTAPDRQGLRRQLRLPAQATLDPLISPLIRARVGGGTRP